VIGAYFPNGQAPDSDKFAYKMRWLDALREWVRSEMQTHPQLALVGDYNITFDDLDVWDPVGLKETIHCTTAEREKLQALIDLGLTDSMRLFEQPEKNYSWWDYRDFAFRRNRGLRIDHILISEALKARASACAVDKAPRKNERPSDHAPVVLTLA
jgi:exodeoxyribonuclease-3